MINGLDYGEVSPRTHFRVFLQLCSVHMERGGGGGGRQIVCGGEWVEEKRKEREGSVEGRLDWISRGGEVECEVSHLINSSRDKRERSADGARSPSPLVLTADTNQQEIRGEGGETIPAEFKLQEMTGSQEKPGFCTRVQKTSTFRQCCIKITSHELGTCFYFLRFQHNRRRRKGWNMLLKKDHPDQSKRLKKDAKVQ